MGNIVDTQALYNVGKAMGRGETRDYRQQDQMMNMIGGQVIGMLGNAFAKRATMRREASKTATNANINLEDGGYDSRMLNQATSVVEKGKKDLYKASGIFKNKNKGAELIERTNNDLKNLQTGMDWVKDKVDVWKGIYENGTFKTSKGDMKVGINPASSVESQELASSFADGSIYDNVIFKDGQWGIMQTVDADGDLQRPEFISLDKLELPELDESKGVLDFEKAASKSSEERGYKSQDGDFSPFRAEAREAGYDEYMNMTYNQISSRFFNKSSDGSYPALNYLMQEDGFTIGGINYPAIKDPSDLNVSAEEQIERQNIASGYLEMLKEEDLQSNDKLNFLLDNQFMPDVEEKFQRGFNSRPVKEEKEQEYKSAYSQTEVARIDKRNLAQTNFSSFMKPGRNKTEAELQSEMPGGANYDPNNPQGSGEASTKPAPTPAQQIGWVNKNINANIEIVHNPKDPESGEVQNGYYKIIRYQQPKEGAKIEPRYELISKGDNINFDDLTEFDYNLMKLENRMVKK
tara:strand:- start:291 stop:1850 length:1560 start_codon:yes stop_codon:yes gene_type:complete